MASNNLLKRLLDTGMTFSGMTQEQAEKIVKELVKAGQARRKDSAAIIEQLISRSRDAGGAAVATLQAELTKQLGRIAARLDGVEQRVEELAQKVGLVSKPAPAPVAQPSPAKKAPAKKAPAKKAAAKKAAAPKSPAKKAPAKKAAAKKAPAKKAAAKKAPAKKA
jgi:polyhydroxyalkanoate synthesis regulator phasin